METMSPAHIEGLDMMSLDAFEQTHPYIPPPAKMATLTPPSDGAYTDEFHIKCQAKGLTQYFTFMEPSKGCFLATVHIDNQPLDKVGPYASKKAAKEAACMAALSKLEAFPDKAELKRAAQQKALPAVRSLDHNTGEYSHKVNMICQQKNLVPYISYTEHSKSCFSANMKIDDEVMGEVGLFANKRDAKEELCKVTYPKLLAVESRRKRKNSDVQDELPGTSEALKEENWIGTLLEHCQRSKIEYPIYSETCVHPSHGPFSCAVHFSGSPPSGFGSTAGPFKRKAEAKKNAAMEAVLWLRYQDKLVGCGSHKRQKPTETRQTMLSNFSDAMDINGSPAQTASIGKQVQDLCLRLGIQTPTFELIPLAGSFYNVHATFLPQDISKEPRLSGVVAPIHNVHGKKAAKDECWLALKTLLEETPKAEEAETAESGHL